MMLRFIFTLCVGTLLVMSVGLWFGSQVVPPSFSSTLYDVFSRSVEGLYSVATWVAKSEDALDEPEAPPVLVLTPPDPKGGQDDLHVQGVRGRNEPTVAEIAQTLPGPPAPFLGPRQVEVAIPPEPAPSLAGMPPDPEAWADRIRRMLAIYTRVGAER